MMILSYLGKSFIQTPDRNKEALKKHREESDLWNQLIKEGNFYTKIA